MNERSEPNAAGDARSGQVEVMAGFGLPEAQIAEMLGMDVEALRRDYRVELGHGRSKANLKVAENLYRKATGDGREAVTAAIFWMKARAGWKEVNVHQVGGNDESRPIRIERVIIEPGQYRPGHPALENDGAP